MHLSYRSPSEIADCPAAWQVHWRITWRWTYRCKITGQVVEESELMSALEALSIDSTAQPIRGTHVMRESGTPERPKWW